MAIQTDSRYDSTQESLNIEAYMQNNSTLAIEEVDEDDYKDHLPLIRAIQKPRELPPLSSSPQSIEQKGNKQKNNRKRSNKRKLDSWIFIEDNES